MIDLLKYIYNRAKMGINVSASIIIVTLIAYISFRIGSCNRPEPQVIVQTKTDTVLTIKEIPIAFKEALKSEKPDQSFIRRVLKPIKEAQIEAVRQIVVRDTVFQPKFLNPNRQLVYQLSTDRNQIVVRSIKSPNELFETRFTAPDWWRDFTLTTSEAGVKIYHAGKQYLRWEGVNVLVEFVIMPETLGRVYLWTGLLWAEKFSTQAFFSSRGEVGLRTNIRF